MKPLDPIALLRQTLVQRGLTWGANNENAIKHVQDGKFMWKPSERIPRSVETEYGLQLTNAAWHTKIPGQK